MHNPAKHHDHQPSNTIFEPPLESEILALCTAGGTYSHSWMMVSLLYRVIDKWHMTCVSLLNGQPSSRSCGATRPIAILHYNIA